MNVFINILLILFTLTVKAQIPEPRRSLSKIYVRFYNDDRKGFEDRTFEDLPYNSMVDYLDTCSELKCKSMILQLSVTVAEIMHDNHHSEKKTTLPVPQETIDLIEGKKIPQTLEENKNAVILIAKLLRSIGDQLNISHENPMNYEKH